MSFNTISLLLRKTIGICFTFYRSFMVAAWLTTVIGLAVFWKNGIISFTAVFWFKILGMALVYYFINTSRAREFYYYRNLGMSKLMLWTVTLVGDFLLYLFFIILTYRWR